MLSIRNLIKNHGDRNVLRGVSLELGRGHVGVLVGPSGSGKSTVLRCINGLEEFQGGSIRVGETEVTAEDSAADRHRQLLEVRRRVGMVFQQFNLFPHLNVLGNVIESPVHVLKQSREEAIEQARVLLERVGLGDRLDSRPDQLSGGQQQRVAIARALAMRPALMLFDEPTSALDPRMTSEVLEVISQLAREGQTMLVVTHAMGFARRVADQVLVVEEGVIVESGPPEQVFDQPQTEATRQFLEMGAGNG
jgi:ABC-type polar amino acid transport system ATPase subunit